MNDQTTYPVGHQFSIGYSPIEDRLILNTNLKEFGPTTLMLTRRMVLLVLERVLERLPNFTGLDQTPSGYWQEVLEFTHQQAVEQHRQESAKAANRPEQPTMATDSTETPQPSHTQAIQPLDKRIFLATELTCEQTRERLNLAFKGIPMPEGIQAAVPQAPVLALSLEAIHVHQVLQLLVTHAARANWHLPVDPPWMRTKGDNQGARTPSH